MNLSKKLFDLRKERNLSQDDVGKAVGVYKSQVSNWENGKDRPSLENVVGLARFFQVSTDYLLLENLPKEGVEAIKDFELYEFFRKAEALPEEEKITIKKVVDAVVFKQKVNDIPEAKPSPPRQAQPALRKVAGKR
jgi:transcriptional regulator with XRE-family HTH domain